MAICMFRRLVLCVLVLSAFSAMGAEIRAHIRGTGGYRVIIIEGKIEPGDFDAFTRTVKENQGQVSSVMIYSPGGDFVEAMKIGRAMRTLELSSMVPGRDKNGAPKCGDLGIIPGPSDPKNCVCASAGFFMHIGAVGRGGLFLAVHRPYFEKGAFGQLSEADAKKAFDKLQDSAKQYMEEMGVPKHVQEDVLGTSSDQALVLDDKTVRTYFVGDIPYRHEWVRNKCSKLSDTENGRMSDLSARLQRSGFRPEKADFSKEDWTDFSALQKKQGEESKCAIAVHAQKRLEGYEKFFKAKPSDYTTHDFGRWVAAAKYLGKDFDEIKAAEMLEEEKSTGITFLRRGTTAKTPYISMSDSPAKPRVVSSVSVLSAPSPSPEFLRRLLAAVEADFGKRTGGNGTTEWVWDKDSAQAFLKAEPASAEGPYLSLKFQGR